MAAIAASLAGATPPSRQTSVQTAKGVTAETFKLTTPQEVTVTQKYKVKVRVKGKLVTKTRTRKVKKTVDTPFVSCNATATCDVTMQTLTFQPGGFSGWHHHPGLVVVVVKSGQITRYKGDCSKQTFTAGQSFVEMGEHDLVFVKNEGSTVTEVQNTLINAAGAATRIDESAPANCNPSAAERTFVSERYGFRVTLPEDWSEADALVDWDGKQLQGLASPAFARFTDPATSRTLVAAAAPVPEGMQLAEWRAAMVRATPAVCPDPSPVEETTLGGEPAVAWTHTCTDGYDVNKLVALHGRRGYITFLASQTANDDAEDRRIFESIRSSFRFTRKRASLAEAIRSKEE